MEQIVWYEANRGYSFVDSFKRNVLSAIDILTTMPTIGIKIKESDGKDYRSFAIHKRCTMYYWYNEKELHIINLQFKAVKQMIETKKETTKIVLMGRLMVD